MWDWADPRKSVLLAPGGDVRLEQLDADGHDWFADGPGGTAMGDLASVLGEVVSAEADPEWLEAARTAITVETALGERRGRLLVQRGGRRMFHVARSESRASIDAHGLDWRRMSGQGAAGSTAPEYPGIYVSDSLEEAEYFTSMVGRRGSRADIWSVDTAGLWLEGARDADLGGSDSWMIVPSPIERSRITLVAKDV